MSDPHSFEFAQPPMSRARFRVYLGTAALIGGLLAAAVGMALGRDGETLMLGGMVAAFLGAGRVLWGLLGVSYDD